MPRCCLRDGDPEQRSRICDYYCELSRCPARQAAHYAYALCTLRFAICYKFHLAYACGRQSQNLVRSDQGVFCCTVGSLYLQQKLVSLADSISYEVVNLS